MSKTITYLDNFLTPHAITIPDRIDKEWRLAIERGMEFLDNYFERPDWVNEIDLETLEVSNRTACVCGQLFATQAKQEAFERAQDDPTYKTYGTLPDYSGYDWALRHVIEHDIPELGERNLAHFNTLPESASYYGFNLPASADQRDVNVQEIREENPDYERGIPIWKLYNLYWKEAIRTRQEELA